MKLGFELHGVPEALGALEDRKEKGGRSGSPAGRVGYTAPYAAFVHEDLEAHHDDGQAKFLEQPARQMRAQLRKVVADEMRHGATLPEAIQTALGQLLDASRALVPVDTGYLKDSGYVEVED